MMPNEGKLILCALFARSQDGRMVLFCYYLLGGDTAAPSGLYARLCHAFLVSSFFSPLGKLAGRAIYFAYGNFYLFFFTMSKAISVSTGPIFTIFFRQMKGVCMNFLDQVKFFFDLSRDVAMSTNFVS